MRWIIGDIHGMLRPLEALLRELARRDPWAHLLFVGDYVNRGPNSRGVLELLSTLRNAHFVRGNHDDIFDLVLHGSCYVTNPTAPDPVSAFVWFMNHGLDNTFGSYGIDYAELEYAKTHPSSERIKRFAEAVPEKHRRFIRKLLPVIEHDDLFVAHGQWDINEPDAGPGITERLAADPRHRARILWGRYAKEIPQKKRWKRTGYFGHSPVESYPESLRPGGANVPIKGPNIVLLDTGAAVSASGRLSAVCAESGEIVQAERNGTLVPEAKPPLPGTPRRGRG